MLLVRLLLLISALSLFCVAVTSQGKHDETLQGRSDSEQETWYSTTANQITKSNSAVKAETIRQDISVIRVAEPLLHERLAQEGRGDVDVRMITSAAWREFRRDHPNERLEKDKFIKFAAEEFGILEVTSTPNEADIRVDAKPWADKTDAENGVRVGTRHVTISKSGYEDAEGDSEVKKGGHTLFDADLKPKPKSK